MTFKIFPSLRFREIAGALEEALSDTLEEAPGKLLLQKDIYCKGISCIDSSDHSVSWVFSNMHPWFT